MEIEEAFRRAFDLHKGGRLRDAEAAYRRALVLKPDYLKAINNLGLVLMDMGRLDEAVEAFNGALAIKPDDTGVLNNLAIALKNMGRSAENLEIRRRLVEANPDDPVARSSMIFAMNWDPAHDAEAILRESRQWDQRHAKPLQHLIQPLGNDRDPGRRLRVGYVAAEFWTHSVSFFFVPLLRNHDRGNFEIFCFSNVERPDKITALIRAAADGWHEIFRLSDDRAADLIRQQRIDILVDLSGHSVHNRLLVFARRVAPVQINYQGYPATTGLSAMDYRLTDSHSDPPGKTEHLHTEQLLRLPSTNWCYSPLEETPPVGPSRAAAGSPVCFGSFNHLAKITPGIIDLWARVLQAAPASRLLLKSAGFAAPSVRRQITERFASHGVDSGRIELLGRQPNIAAHLELYGRMDIALDTFPYHGTTTTCEALWMGVPVVTLAGEVHLSRVGVSLLHNVGLPELVARDADEYVSIAAGLAGNLPKLEELRRTLRRRMLASPLMNGPQFARDVEGAYRDAWQRWCAKE